MNKNTNPHKTSSAKKYHRIPCDPRNGSFPKKPCPAGAATFVAKWHSRASSSKTDSRNEDIYILA